MVVIFLAQSKRIKKSINTLFSLLWSAEKYIKNHNIRIVTSHKLNKYLYDLLAWRFFKTIDLGDLYIAWHFLIFKNQFWDIVHSLCFFIRDYFNFQSFK